MDMAVADAHDGATQADVRIPFTPQTVAITPLDGESRTERGNPLVLAVTSMPVIAARDASAAVP